MLRESQEAGLRRVSIVFQDSEKGVLVIELETDKDTSRYDVQDVDTRRLIYRMSKLGKRGKPLAGHTYLVQPRAEACECRGRRLGNYRCRHVAALMALIERNLL